MQERISSKWKSTLAGVVRGKGGREVGEGRREGGRGT